MEKIWGREMKRNREEEEVAGGDDGIWGETGWAVGDKTIWPLEANGGEWSKGPGEGCCCGESVAIHWFETRGFRGL
jgi:hypothetical protein